MATSVSIDFVDFLYRTPKYRDRINNVDHVLTILFKVIGDDKLHLELLICILNFELVVHWNSIKQDTASLLDCVLTICIQNDRIEYLEYIFKNIILFYTKNRIHLLFLGCQENCQKYKSDKCSAYIENIIQTQGIERFCNRSKIKEE